MKKKSAINRLNLALTVVFVIAFVLAGCSNNKPADSVSKTGESGTAANDTKKNGGTLKVAQIGNPVDLGYPAEQRVIANLSISTPGLETLGRYDAQGKMTPWLADSWQADYNSKTITFKLKQGIKFHDGIDFNAEALKWNIQQFIDAKRPEVKGIQTMDVVDPYTLKLNLSEWNSSLTDSICFYVQVISPAAFQKNGGKDWATKNPVGTGPFKFVSWENDVAIKWKKNENYWQEGKPYLDAVEYRILADTTTAASSFKSKELDVLNGMLPQTAKELEQSGKYTMSKSQSGLGSIGTGLMPDSGNPNSPFANVKVRQALAYAIDAKKIAESTGQGYAQYTNQWGLPGSWYYTQDVKGFTFDPAKAKQLLTEAGYPNGFKTKLGGLQGHEPVLTAVQSYLSQVGIEAKIDLVDGAKWSQTLTSKWDGIWIWAFQVDADPPLQMSRVYDINGVTYTKNITHPDTIQKLLGDLRTAPDADAKKKLTIEMEKAIYDEYTIAIPISVPIITIAKQPTVMDDGFAQTHAYIWTPEDAWLKK
jgi:peptide/nickel transport system substrate-binding protein